MASLEASSIALVVVLSTLLAMVLAVTFVVVLLVALAVIDSGNGATAVAGNGSSVVVDNGIDNGSSDIVIIAGMVGSGTNKVLVTTSYTLSKGTIFEKQHSM